MFGTVCAAALFVMLLWFLTRGTGRETTAPQTEIPAGAGEQAFLFGLRRELAELASDVRHIRAEGNAREVREGAVIAAAGSLEGVMARLHGALTTHEQAVQAQAGVAALQQRLLQRETELARWEEHARRLDEALREARGREQVGLAAAIEAKEQARRAEGAAARGRLVAERTRALAALAAELGEAQRRFYEGKLEAGAAGIVSFLLTQSLLGLALNAEEGDARGQALASGMAANIYCLTTKLRGEGEAFVRARELLLKGWPGAAQMGADLPAAPGSHPDEALFAACLGQLKSHWALGLGPLIVGVDEQGRAHRAA